MSCFGITMSIFIVSSCSKINDIAPQNSLNEDPIQTETISGIFPVEVYVPGVYVTAASDKVGVCEEKQGNICMIIRCSGRSVNSTPVCTALLPNENSFVNPIEKTAELLEVIYEPTTLSQNDLTNVWVSNTDGSTSLKGIAIKENSKYMFNLKLRFN